MQSINLWNLHLIQDYNIQLIFVCMLLLARYIISFDIDLKNLQFVRRPLMDRLLLVPAKHFVFIMNYIRYKRG